MSSIEGFYPDLKIDYQKQKERDRFNLLRLIKHTVLAVPLVFSAATDISRYGSSDNSPVYQPNNQLFLSGWRPDDLSQLEMPENPVQVVTGEFETISNQGVTITRIFGENQPNNINILILPDNFSSFEEAKQRSRQLVEYFYLVRPLEKFLDKFTFWVRDPTGMENMRCFEFGPEGKRMIFCGTSADVPGDASSELIRERDRTIEATGIFMQETVILRNTNEVMGRGTALDEGRVPPSLDTAAIIGLPPNPDFPDKMIAAHELAGHGILDLLDEYVYPWAYTNPLPVGTKHWNCTEEPNWEGIPGDPGKRYEGCSSQRRGAWRTSRHNVMNTPPLSPEYATFGELNSWWLEEMLNGKESVSRRYNKPEFRAEIQGNMIKQGEESEQVIQLNNMDILAHLQLPKGITQIMVKLIPVANPTTGQPDGPGIFMIYGDTQKLKEFEENGYEIKAPKLGEGNYILLPDMSYPDFEIWISGANVPLAADSPDWGKFYPYPLKEASSPPIKFRLHTPERDSDSIVPLNLGEGEITGSLRPTLVWDNSDKDVFYYEIQLSKDPNFETDPHKAKAAVYWNLVHGGESDPLNSWMSWFDLDSDTTYYWRVRPRIQGDGQPVPWSKSWYFKTE
ncbi:hypothetical protein HYT18_01635 [Candidatus Microgenomates bacterium]|nr:hypothetical protein [Candidatus Microgenomates bacterium]